LKKKNKFFQILVVCITTTHSSLNNFPENTPLFELDDDGKWLLDEEEQNYSNINLPNEENLLSDDLAYIVYSSGTTGKPKG
jgi:acyl-coenzyme A synthetase/AMP-(fatty) acid ligase